MALFSLSRYDAHAGTGPISHHALHLLHNVCRRGDIRDRPPGSKAKDFRHIGPHSQAAEHVDEDGAAIEVVIAL